MQVLEEKNENILLLICAAIYVVLRVIAWNSAVILDDHDSIFYLKSINAYRSLEFPIINDLSAYSTIGPGHELETLANHLHPDGCIPYCIQVVTVSGDGHGTADGLNQLPGYY